jgi:hypothetical protein
VVNVAAEQTGVAAKDVAVTAKVVAVAVGDPFTGLSQSIAIGL